MITLEPDEADYASIIALAEPDWRDRLTESRIERLFDVTAGDLRLLDEAIGLIKGPEAIDTLSTASLGEKFLLTIWGAA